MGDDTGGHPRLGSVEQVALQLGAAFNRRDPTALAALYAEARRIREVVNYHVAKEAPRVVYRTKVVYRDAPRYSPRPRVRRVAEQPMIKRTNIRQYYPAMSQGVIILP